jgi:N-acetylmuramic acid 6-phosphate (MurNAc-6-P) etherase
MTPFAQGLTRARPARKSSFACDPRTELQTFVDPTIAPAVVRVIAGLTRLKAGTATSSCSTYHDRRDGSHRQDVRESDG